MAKSDNSTNLASIMIWVGIAVYGYFVWHFPSGRPTDFVSYLSVGALFSAGILIFGEVGARMMGTREVGGIDRSFGAAMLLGAIALALSLIYNLIMSGQPGLLAALFVGAALYLALLRHPLVVVTR